MTKATFIAALLVASSCNLTTINNGAISRSPLMGIVASNNYQTKTFEAGNFDEIKVNGAYKVVFTPGEFSVRIEAPDNVVDHLKIEVDGDELKLSHDHTRIKEWKTVTAYISAPRLSEIVFNGAGSFEAREGVSSEDFEAVINGAGNIEISNLDCREIEAEINGAGNIEIKGKAAHAEIRVNGAGNINVKDLVCEDLDAKVAGAGKVRR